MRETRCATERARGGLVSGGAQGIVSSPDLSQAIDIAQTDIAKRDASER